MADILGSNGQIIAEVRTSGAIAVAPGSNNGAVPVQLSAAATVAAAANNQTLAAGVGQRTYITDFYVDGLGATGASTILITITGLLGGTRTYQLAIPAGVTTLISRLAVQFPYPIAASADNTAIVVNVPSFGAGNTASNAGASGFRI